jgi:hypothetical protein
MAVAIDRDGDAASVIMELKPWAVVDASGPFDAGQNRAYRIVEASVAARAHYLDIADGRDFVAGIASMDRGARQAGVTVLSGASTTPALSSAVCDVLTKGLSRVDTIEIGISPGNRAPRGLAVIRSILSYAGKPVRIWQGGQWASAPGWSLMVRRNMHGLGSRWLSLCDAPDLALFPERYRVKDSVIFRGGLELSILHLGLWLASLLVRCRLLPSLARFAEGARDLADLLLPFGTDCGGMIAQACGKDDKGKAVRRTWTLVAEAGDGPNVPVLAAYAALQALASGTPPPTGARPCLGEIPLAKFEELFLLFRIRTIRRDGSNEM